MFRAKCKFFLAQIRDINTTLNSPFPLAMAVNAQRLGALGISMISPLSIPNIFPKLSVSIESVEWKIRFLCSCAVLKRERYNFFFHFFIPNELCSNSPRGATNRGLRQKQIFRKRTIRVVLLKKLFK